METQIENALRQAVLDADLESSTILQIRAAVIEKLKLEPDFFKLPEWKKKSAEIIDEAISLRMGGASDREVENKNAQKRPGKPKNQRVKSQSKTKTGSTEELFSTISQAGSASPRATTKSQHPKTDSIKDPSAKSQSKSKSVSTKADSTTRKSQSAGSDQIPKLKSQLLKCGIRKQWAKLLDPLPNEKARIAYLQSQLAEIGMTGRFSEAKAKQIKQEREMALEISELNEAADKFTNGPSRKMRKIAVSDDED
jgi:hypothetical protein